MSDKLIEHFSTGFDREIQTAKVAEQYGRAAELEFAKGLAIGLARKFDHHALAMLELAMLKKELVARKSGVLNERNQFVFHKD